MTNIKNLFSYIFVITVCGLTLNSCYLKSDEEILESTESTDVKPPYAISAESELARNDLQKEYTELHETLMDLETKLLAPLDEDNKEFEEFLKLSQNGLTRLYPAKSLQGLKLIEGGASYFQFKNRIHKSGYGSDLQFTSDVEPTFSVGFSGVDYGFIIPLGKIDIREIEQDSLRVQFALDQKHFNNEPMDEWRSEQDKWQKGVRFDSVLVSNTQKAIVGEAYALRSAVAFKHDVVVVFQVIRRETGDGSLIIAWTMLKDFGPPKSRD